MKYQTPRRSFLVNTMSTPFYHSHTPTHTHIKIHTYTLSLSHTHTHTKYIHTLSHTHTHTHTQTHTHIQINQKYKPHTQSHYRGGIWVGGQSLWSHYHRSLDGRRMGNHGWGRVRINNLM